MSYEGFEQWLCEQGHYHTFDCYELPNTTTWRCHCGLKLIWFNAVDQTNGQFCLAWSKKENKCDDVVPEDYDDCNGEYPYQFCPEEMRVECIKSGGRIDNYVELEVLEETKYSEPCKECGHIKMLNERTYKIPEKGGHKI